MLRLKHPDCGFVFRLLLAPNIEMTKRSTDGAWFFRDQVNGIKRWTPCNRVIKHEMVKTGHKARLPKT